MSVDGIDEHKAHAVDLHSETASEFATRYRALAEDPYHSTFTYGRKKIEELIDRELAALAPVSAAEGSRPVRALDVGCGTGFNVARLRARGFDVVGIEPAARMRETAQANNPGADIRDGDIEALPFADGAFDLVVSIEVIRYLPAPGRALGELARVLRPGGLAIVTAAPLLSLNGYALINVVTSRLKVPTFTRVKHSFMTAGGARRAALAAGFGSAEVHGLFLGPWHALGRVSPAALGTVLRACEPLDDRLSDRGPLRDLANHLVIVAHK